MTEEQKRERKRAYDHQYFLAHKDVKRQRTAAWMKRWVETHREESRERSRQYAAKHRNEQRLKSARYRAEHAEQTRARVRQWRAEHAVENRAKQKEYAAEHRQEVRARIRRWHEAHLEERRAKAREYARNNHDKQLAHWRNRKARVAGAPGRHTGADILRLFDQQQGRCAACGTALAKSGPKRYHVDHVMPLIRGGSNDPGNLQLLCKPCNLRKSDRLPAEWAAR